RELAGVIEAPWMLATSEDFRVRGTEGGSPGLKTCLMHRYMDQVIRLTTVDRDVRLAFLKVMHMLESPATLFRPSVAMRVIRQAASWSSRLVSEPVARVQAKILNSETAFRSRRRVYRSCIFLCASTHV